ncbi:MAG: rhodanese-like domain-containing protein [Bacteroidota bacterium]
MKLIDIDEFKTLASGGYTIVDTRKPEIFTNGFLKGAISITFDENFISAFQELIEGEQKVLFIADEEVVPLVSKQLKAAGIQNVEGFLKGGFDASKVNGKLFDLLIAIDTEEFAIDYRFDEFYLVDVRPTEEFEKEHLEDAENVTLNDLEQLLVDLDPADSYYVYANSFAESVTAGSLFKKDGFERVKVVADSYENMKLAELPVVSPDKKKTPSDKFSNN